MMIRTIFVLQLLTSLFCVSNSNAQFESQQVSFSLYKGEEYICEVWAKFEKFQSLEPTFERKSLSACLEKKLTDGSMAQLRDGWKDLEYISAEELNRGGLKTSVNVEYYRADVMIPRDWIRSVSVSLKQPEERDSDFLKPAFVSSYLNYSLNKTFRSGESGPDSNLLLNPVLSVKGNVLESFHQLDQNGAQRLETRVTHDFEEKMLRVIGGDQYSKQTSLMVPMQFSGLTLTREFAMNPGFVSRPLGSKEIFLEQASRVDIFVNNILFRTLNLQAGKHLIEDIPENLGINNVTLKITGPSGNSKIIQFQSSTEDYMLQKGLNDFTFQGGRLARTGAGSSIGYLDQGAFSAYFRHGMSDVWTSGFFSQWTTSNFLGGVENAFASRFGIVRNQLAYSNSYGQSGCAGRLEYVWSCPCYFGGRGSRFAIGGDWYSPDFIVGMTPTSFATTRKRWSIFTTYTFAFGDRFSAQLRGDYGQQFAEDQKSISGGIDLNKSIQKNLFVSMGYTQDHIFGGAITHTGKLQLILQLDEGRESITNLTTLSKNSSNRLDAFYNQRKPINNLLLQAHTETADGAQSGGFGGSFASQYGDLNGSMNYDGVHGNSVYRLNPAGSLVFVDGHFGIGRPVQDGFVLVKNYHDKSVYVNGLDDYESKVFPHLTGVLINAQSYRDKLLAVSDFSDEIYGSNLNQSFRVRPTYKTGVLVKVAHEKLYSVKGTLRDSSNKLVKLAAGKLVSKDGKGEVSFFTGYEGEFFIEKIEPGIYSLTSFNLPFEVTEVDLSQLKERVTDVGLVKLRKIVFSN